jgi:hypothetical protein
VVRKKYENHAKSIKLNTTEAGKSLREFHQATRDYRLRKDNSTKEREKELYWRHVIRVQTEGDRFLQ